MDTEHPDIQRALESEKPSNTRYDLFRRAIIHLIATTPNGQEKNEILDEIERDLAQKERIGDINLQERMALMIILHGKSGVDYAAMGS